MAYHKHPPAREAEFGWMLPLVGGFLAIVLILAALPTLLIGFVSHRYTSKYSWNFAFWLVLLLPGALAFSYLWQHGLQALLLRELFDYIQNVKHHQLNFAEWNVRQLWAETWPVWIRVLVALPLVGFWQALSLNVQGGSSPQRLNENERSRQHRVTHAQERALKLARRPDRLPDAADGLMVIGVPIDDEEQE